MKKSNISEIFENNGFVVIKNVLKKSQINELMNDLDRVKNKVEKKHNQFFHKTPDNKFNTIHNIQKFHKKGSIIELAKNKKIQNICKTLIGKKTMIRNIEFFLKPKKSGMPSPFHQDNYYWNIINAEATNVWIACSKVSKRNGGICYFKGSHKLGIIKHEISNMKGSSQMISDKIIKNLGFKRVFPKLNPGDCLIHHPEVIHGSFKNNSNTDRIGFVVSYTSISHKIDKQRLREYKDKLIQNLKKIYNN